MSFGDLVAVFEELGDGEVNVGGFENSPEPGDAVELLACIIAEILGLKSWTNLD